MSLPRYYEVLLDEDRNGFNIIVDKTYEDDIRPEGCFDTSDAEEIIRGIHNGTYDWFMLRVRVLVDGIELASSYLGACCYEDARQVLTDGTAEGMIEEAMGDAARAACNISEKFSKAGFIPA